MKRKIPSLLELYRQLISIPSISSNKINLNQSNEDIINLLMEWFSNVGFNVNLKLVSDQPRKFNMIAQKGSGEGGLLLVGHTDTVPYNDIYWTHDPFTLVEDHNKLYGLGSVDMKGFFAFILDVLCDLDITKLNKPLYILATADEEISMAGAQDFLKSTQIFPDYAIIGEPTSLKPVRMHKGHISNVIRINGQEGHSSCPETGINAIELMHESITQLILLRDFFKRKYNNLNFNVSYPTINFGHIQGGDVANRICGNCRLYIDIRPIPGLTLNTINDFLNETLTPIKVRWPGCLTIDELHPPIPSYECPANTKLVKTIEGILGIPSEAVNYCTEASFIQKLCPTLVLGPGSINQAHQPDEYLHSKFINPTLVIFKKIIEDFCFK